MILMSDVRTSPWPGPSSGGRSEEHTSELQSQSNLVCRLLLEKKTKTKNCLLLPRHSFPRHTVYQCPCAVTKRLLYSRLHDPVYAHRAPCPRSSMSCHIQPTE